MQTTSAHLGKKICDSRGNSRVPLVATRVGKRSNPSGSPVQRRNIFVEFRLCVPLGSISAREEHGRKARRPEQEWGRHVPADRHDPRRAMRPSSGGELHSFASYCLTSYMKYNASVVGAPVSSVAKTPGFPAV